MYDEYQMAQLKRSVRSGFVKKEPDTGVVYVAFDEAVVNIANEAQCVAAPFSEKDVANLKLADGDHVQVRVDLSSVSPGSEPTFTEIQKQFVGTAGVFSDTPVIGVHGLDKHFELSRSILAFLEQEVPSGLHSGDVLTVTLNQRREVLKAEHKPWEGPIVGQ